MYRTIFLTLALIFALVSSTVLRSPSRRATQLPDVVTYTSRDATAQPDAPTKLRLNNACGQLPLSFEANGGQTDPQVDFISRGSGYTLFLTPREAVLAMRAASATVLRMKFVGGESRPRVTGQQELPGKINYLIGKDPKHWRTGISTYEKVAYQNIYPGVDLIYYGNQRQLEYDFIVQPGTDPDVIALSFTGADQLKVDTQGELVLQTGRSEIRQRKPSLYQEVDGVRHEVAGSYKLKDGNTVGFEVANYDASKPLVIDPVLVYSTVIGGAATSEESQDITTDRFGNAYITGNTEQLLVSSDFPTTVGAFDTTHNGSQDVFVAKLNSSGSALVYSTFVGGSGDDLGRSIAVDASGNAYVAGLTSSPNFPTTVGAFDATHNGGLFDAFVTKLNPTGSALDYSTFLGGSNSDRGNGIALDTSGNAYVTGDTSSSNFPTTAGVFDTTANGDVDVFVTKLDSSGSALVYSTLLGSSGAELEPRIALDTSGSAYVVGSTFSPNFPVTLGAFDTTHNGSFVFATRSDAFVAKFNPSASLLVYSTFLGGTGSDFGRDIAVDASGSAYVTGGTSSSDFPTTPGVVDTTRNDVGSSDVFVTKLNPSGSAPLVYSTFLGGSDFDQGDGIDVDHSGIAYVTGFTLSLNFPTTIDNFGTTHPSSGVSDVFVTKLNPFASPPIITSTYFGGSLVDHGTGIDVDNFGNAYVTGITISPDFPTTPGAFDTTHNGSSDAFVIKFSTVGFPQTITFNPPSATNPVDSQHCLTAIVQDALGNPLPNLVVRFQVTGSVDAFGAPTADSSGKVTFCYFGPPLPGADTITAYADPNNNNVQDPGEPVAMAEKTWVFPLSTPRCEIANGGWIVAENGERATFGGHAKVNESGETQGLQQYIDHGRAQGFHMQSLNVVAVICDGSTRASILGQATIDGSGLFNFRIYLQDLGGSGKDQHDTYQLLIDSYNSGEQVIRRGNIQILRH
jgi:beta-propeller repeat-containing protein